ncbi:hypothetical protein P9112_005408 [Eukaryota sp. TZLM1-RC]
MTGRDSPQSRRVIQPVVWSKPGARLATGRPGSPLYKRGHRDFTDLPQPIPISDIESSCSSISPSQSPVCDDEGYFIVRPGQSLTERYTVIQKLGQGTFGTVLECYDKQRRYNVAIKVVRAIERYTEAAIYEKCFLRDLYAHKSYHFHTITLLGWFVYEGHVCLSFEKGGPSLLSLIRTPSLKGRGLEKDCVKTIGFQIFRCLNFLHNDRRIIHTDLKPENILCAEEERKEVLFSDGTRHELPKNLAIKIIDFGSAVAEYDRRPSICCTRQYRPPEVVFGLEWSFPVDIWAAGCILAELASGKILFPAHSNWEHLQMFEAVLERKIPRRFLSEDSYNRDRNEQVLGYFNSRMNVRKITKDRDVSFITRYGSPRSSEYASKDIEKSTKLLNFIKSNQKLKDICGDDVELYDLLKRCLEYHPEKRLTADEGYLHPWFKDIKKLEEEAKERKRQRRTNQKAEKSKDKGKVSCRANERVSNDDANRGPIWAGMLKKELRESLID